MPVYNKLVRNRIPEIIAGGDLAELADLVEVVYAIVAHKGFTPEAFEQLRRQKQQERGAFARRLFLIQTEN